MKILVTGCAGLIGSHLVDNLIKSGYDVVGIDNLSYGSLKNIEEALNSDKFKFIQGDVTMADIGQKWPKSANIFFSHRKSFKVYQVTIWTPGNDS